MKKICIYLAFAFLATPALVLAGTVRTVDINGGGDYATIQAAVDASSSGDEVRVAKGTYVERVAMKAGVNLFGGYSSVGWTRDIEKNTTIIFANNTGIAVTAATAALDGFTIKGSGASGIVAGVYVYGCSPTISNNRITLNGKNGIYVEGNASPTIRNNVVSSNTGYGIYCYSFGNGGTPHIYNNTVDGNKRGIVLYAFSPVIKNNIVTSSSEYGISASVGYSTNEDYNDLWSNAQGNYYGQPAGGHDKSADPIYAGGGDYRLSASPTISPCIDAGVDVGLPYNRLPDMGAYESASIRTVPWPPEGLMASPGCALVKLDWLPNNEPEIAGYKISYGNVSRSYTTTVDVHNVTECEVRSLLNDATYYFAVQAHNTLDNTSDYSAEASATPTAGLHELPHYDWDESYGGGDCTACHYKYTGNGELLPAGYDYRYSSELCLSCHGVTGRASGKTVDRAKSHPVFVNVTAGGNNMPTYGNLTGRFSTRMGDHLKDGGLIVCNTCHNIMEKTEDPGRTWEYTTFTFEDDRRTYAVQNGGWYWYKYLALDAYSSVTFLPRPTYTRDRESRRISPDIYDYSPEQGRIIFSRPFYNYIYVTLRYPYLRVNNSDNAMCLDCHNIGTHELINCLTCHENHDYVNRHGIRPRIKTPNSGLRDVVFTRITGVNSFADGDAAYDGICEVCHTQTRYYRNNGTGFADHSGGFNYNSRNCTECHTHLGGFTRP